MSEGSNRGASEVREWTDVDRSVFENEIVAAGQPAVLRSLVKDWPIAIAGRREADEALSYVDQAAGKATVEAWFCPPSVRGNFGYTDDLLSFNFERRTMPLGDLIAYLRASQGDPAAYTAFAGAVPIPVVLPGLLPHIWMPLLKIGQEKLTSLWIGGRSNTAAHWDVAQNLACVVAGRRRFTLFPTDQVANLYVGPLDRTPAGQAISLVDVADPDLTRFPRFRAAMAASQWAELEPGDALYLPSLWWHHVQSLEPIGAMVNFWWRDGPEWLATPLLTLFHALLTLRELPVGEKVAWQSLFDHYIFGEDDAMAHLPAAARGVFGESSPELRRQLKNMLKGHLG